MPPAAAASASASSPRNRRGGEAAAPAVDVLDGEALEARRERDEEGGFLFDDERFFSERERERESRFGLRERERRSKRVVEGEEKFEVVVAVESESEKSPILPALFLSIYPSP